jgi:cytochrome c-type biogenesis protein CcmH/NrfF
MIAIPAFGYYVIPEDVDAAKFGELAKDLRCPTCIGLSVLNSDEKFATQIKEKIVEQLREGKSREDIMVYFVDRYGPWILREPPKEGFHILAWILPAAMLVFGPILIYFLIWRKRRSYSTLGVRSEELLIDEMMQRLAERKSKTQPMGSQT